VTFTDTHTHLYSKQFDHDRDEMLQRAIDLGVTRFLLPNIDVESIGPMLELEAQWPQNCFPMMGLHPCHVEANFEAQLEVIFDWLHKRPFLAVGEIGLDYYWSKELIPQQKEAFKLQTLKALELDLPIVIHARDSIDDLVELVAQLQNGQLRGVFHCYTGNAKQAQQIIDLGFYLGIGGVVTYKNSDLGEVLQSVPMERLLLETDSPYLAPVPHRGKRNESAYVKHVAEKLSEVYSCSLETIATQTELNTNALFRLT
jgi:TatD DNase family protein